MTWTSTGTSTCSSWSIWFELIFFIIVYSQHFLLLPGFHAPHPTSNSVTTRTSNPLTYICPFLTKVSTYLVFKIDSYQAPNVRTRLKTISVFLMRVVSWIFYYTSGKEHLLVFCFDTFKKVIISIDSLMQCGKKKENLFRFWKSWHVTEIEI